MLLYRSTVVNVRGRAMRARVARTVYIYIYIYIHTYIHTYTIYMCIYIYIICIICMTRIIIIIIIFHTERSILSLFCDRGLPASRNPCPYPLRIPRTTRFLFDSFQTALDLTERTRATRKGTNGISTNGVTASFMFLTEGLFGYSR